MAIEIYVHAPDLSEFGTFSDAETTAALIEREAQIPTRFAFASTATFQTNVPQILLGQGWLPCGRLINPNRTGNHITLWMKQFPERGIAVKTIWERIVEDYESYLKKLEELHISSKPYPLIKPRAFQDVKCCCGLRQMLPTRVSAPPKTTYLTIWRAPNLSDAELYNINAAAKGCESKWRSLYIYTDANGRTIRFLCNGRIPKSFP